MINRSRLGMLLGMAVGSGLLGLLGGLADTPMTAIGSARKRNVAKEVKAHTCAKEKARRLKRYKPTPSKPDEANGGE